MKLNTIRPAAGSRPNAKRVGRGMGCGSGKTSGRGHKGQKSRSGTYRKAGFEGGQMPIQRRLPKVGFSAHRSRLVAEVRLSQLDRLEGDVVDLAVLKAARIIGKDIKVAKIFKSGKLSKSLTVKNLSVTQGAQLAIEAAGGKVENQAKAKAL